MKSEVSVLSGLRQWWRDRRSDLRDLVREPGAYLRRPRHWRKFLTPEGLKTFEARERPEAP